jgi:hypothetical protein
MKSALPIVIVVALILLALFTWRTTATLSDNLPPRTECANQDDANAKATEYATKHGGLVVRVLGTGSMAPYIPAAPASGQVTNVMAYAVVSRSPSGYAGLKPGQLVVYTPDGGNPGLYFIHVAAQKDGAGWIMSGLANKTFENRARVREDNFYGVASAVFVW